MTNEEIKKLEVYTRFTVSRLAFDKDSVRIESIANNDILLSMSYHIKNSHIKRTIEKDYVMYELDLIVATPAEFWNLVNSYAERLARRL